MDELKELVGLIKDTPTFVLWVLLGFLAYKLAVVGSIYGVIRYGLGELFGWLRERKTLPPEVREVVESNLYHPACAPLKRDGGSYAPGTLTFIHREAR